MNKVLVTALVALAALSACGGTRASTTLASAGNGPETTLTTRAADTVTTTGAPSVNTTTTTPASPASTDTTAPPPKESSTTTTIRPATTTTTTTTTTRPAARTVTVSSAPSPYFTTVTVRGDGCAGPDYGVTLSMRDPSGQEIPGDGAATQPDGTWQLQELFNHSQPQGDYTLAASCITQSSAVVFAYAPSTFRWNG